MTRRFDPSTVIIVVVIVAWMALGLWLGAGDSLGFEFAPQCDDFRPRGC